MFHQRRGHMKNCIHCGLLFFTSNTDAILCPKCVEESGPEDVIAMDWLQIGRYAVQFLWSDTHETGIFTFKYLRELDETLRTPD